MTPCTAIIPVSPCVFVPAPEPPETAPEVPTIDRYVGRVWCMDALELMRALPTGSVDAIITDLPYGTTACSWDTVIPFAPMWAAVKRVLKPRGVFVTTASQPFTSALVMSNPSWFRYEWIWHKTQARGHLNALFQPMREHENIVVFASGSGDYYPQIDLKPHENIRPVTPRGEQAKSYGKYKAVSARTIPVEMSYPRSVLKFSNPNRGEYYHPTQKPVALYEYLIRTYTQPGELVLDFCCGSGTTAIAARNTDRRYILGDSSPEYVAIAEKRLALPYTPPLPMFA